MTGWGQVTSLYLLMKDPGKSRASSGSKWSSWHSGKVKTLKNTNQILQQQQHVTIRPRPFRLPRGGAFKGWFTLFSPFGFCCTQRQDVRLCVVFSNYMDFVGSFTRPVVTVSIFCARPTLFTYSAAICSDGCRCDFMLISAYVSSDMAFGHTGSSKGWGFPDQGLCPSLEQCCTSER